MRLLSFDLPPSRWFDTSEFAQRPLYAGLVAGFAGVYQINLRMPDTKPSVTCTPDGRISSNVTITISSLWSFDGMPICLDARDATDLQP